MNMSKIIETVQSEEYSFLRTNPNLQNIALLGLGGSHAYGMDKEGSDLDIRGIALNSKYEILAGFDFEQVVNVETDTTIYSFNKMIELLTKCNPNTIELLGLLPEQYLHISDVGQELLDNKDMFLSQICVQTFGGYASTQLRRLENKAARLVSQTQNEKNILKSIENAKYDFGTRYFPMSDGDYVNLYVDEAVQEGYDSEIFMDVVLHHYPLRDYTGMWNEMKSITSSYAKIGKRNDKAIEHNKLGKHMAHLIRLYMMAIDILEKHEIITYRRDEHDLLMSIRNGEYLDSNRQPVDEFYKLLNEYEKRFDYAKEHTTLPKVPNRKRIIEFKARVNEKIIMVEGGI